ncbi:hypothetical protein J5285_22275 (plasmid) [Agrobacterium larrymoorei]|uniref:Uncharacterized protein n=1 Tax=Agrobacterium larrymoorei TaxID=160699 RepID=A0A4D7E4D9_9HYPH|nr:hypothetical protein CFBP5473_23605 [Agrobacterium larrymoorei]QYA10305.1 hypothetical protein J5285_22275 [Agrobacterium larrymoorei]
MKIEVLAWIVETHPCKLAGSTKCPSRTGSDLGDLSERILGFAKNDDGPRVQKPARFGWLDAVGRPQVCLQPKYLLADLVMSNCSAARMNKASSSTATK